MSKLTCVMDGLQEGKLAFGCIQRREDAALN